jgi:glutamate racemase
MGGLSLALDFRLQGYINPILYLADLENAPYGTKSKDSVFRHVKDATQFLIQNGAEAIILACNTATAVAVDQLRSEFTIPIFGVEPAIKPALKMAESGKVGVLATVLTLEEDKFLSLKNRIDPMNRVIPIPCPGLSDLIDRGEISQAENYIREKIEDLDNREISNYVLGCTHYLFLLPFLKSKFPNYQWFDGNIGTVQHVTNSLGIKSGIENDIFASLRVFCTQKDSGIKPMDLNALGLFLKPFR